MNYKANNQRGRSNRSSTEAHSSRPCLPYEQYSRNGFHPNSYSTRIFPESLNLHQAVAGSSYNQSILQNIPYHWKDAIDKVEFENYKRQASHGEGVGVFYSGVLDNLPPRFKKKKIQDAFETLRQDGYDVDQIRKQTNALPQEQFLEHHSLQNSNNKIQIKFVNAKINHKNQKSPQPETLVQAGCDELEKGHFASGAIPKSNSRHVNELIFDSKQTENIIKEMPEQVKKNKFESQTLISNDKNVADYSDHRERRENTPKRSDNDYSPNRPPFRDKGFVKGRKRQPQNNFHDRIGVSTVTADLCDDNCVKLKTTNSDPKVKVSSKASEENIDFPGFKQSNQVFSKSDVNEKLKIFSEPIIPQKSRTECEMSKDKNVTPNLCPDESIGECAKHNGQKCIKKMSDHTTSFMSRRNQLRNKNNFSHQQANETNKNIKAHAENNCDKLEKTNFPSNTPKNVKKNINNKNHNNSKLNDFGKNVPIGVLVNSISCEPQNTNHLLSTKQDRTFENNSYVNKKKHTKYSNYNDAKNKRTFTPSFENSVQKGDQTSRDFQKGIADNSTKCKPGDAQIYNTNDTEYIMLNSPGNIAQCSNKSPAKTNNHSKSGNFRKSDIITSKSVNNVHKSPSSSKSLEINKKSVNYDSYNATPSNSILSAKLQKSVNLPYDSKACRKLSTTSMSTSFPSERLINNAVENSKGQKNNFADINPGFADVLNVIKNKQKNMVCATEKIEKKTHKPYDIPIIGSNDTKNIACEGQTQIFQHSNTNSAKSDNHSESNNFRKFNNRTSKSVNSTEKSSAPKSLEFNKKSVNNSGTPTHTNSISITRQKAAFSGDSKTCVSFQRDNKNLTNDDAVHQCQSRIKKNPVEKINTQCGDVSIDNKQINEVCATDRDGKTMHEKFTKNYLIVEVSEEVKDLGYWKPLFRSVLLLSNDEFDVVVHSEYTQTLQVGFCHAHKAKEACSKLKKLKKFSVKPHIVHISTVLHDSCKSNIDIKSKIFYDCRITINEMYERCIDEHDKKIQNVKNELKHLRNKRVSSRDTFGDEEMTVLAKLEALDSMKKVFQNYVKKTMNEMNSIEKQSDEKLLKQVKILKQYFWIECNCLKGSLPIYSKKDDILDVIRNNQVSVLVADTGSGKSTQLVQYLLRAGFAGKDSTIVCTQPRKIAAVTITRFVSCQIGSAPGAIVGYEAGVTTKVSQKTEIIYMTDFKLLRKCVTNPSFKGISCVIVDEAHERTLHTDLLLGMLKKCLIKQPNMRVIITSATINPSVFRDYFNLSENAILNIPGRIYPVEVKWQKADSYIGWDYVQACVKCAYDVHCHNKEGDILVFLTSPNETEEAVTLFKEFLRKDRRIQSNRNNMIPDVLSLHGKQDVQDQQRIFNLVTQGSRKVIFATNLAETSVTIPGIKYVIDSGMVKEMQYIADKKRNALVIGFANRSSAEQRKGRAGRTQPGVCYRMYSEKNYQEDMQECSPPEILRVDLQQAVLKILEFKINPEDFDFIEAPAKDSICDSISSLKHLGAIKGSSLSPLGKQMAKLPIDPHLAKLILRGATEGFGYEAVVIASLVSVSGRVFFRTEENKKIADAIKLKFCREYSDFSTFLQVFQEWNFVCQNMKNQWCSDHFINLKAMKTANQIASELYHILWHELSISVSRKFRPTSYNSKIEQVLFECFSENICVFSGHEKTGYVSPFLPGSFFIHPSSAISYMGDKMPMFIIYSSILKTSRNFLLNIAPISESTIIEAHKRGEFQFELGMLQRLQILPKIIRPVGEAILVRYILGRQGSKLHELEEQISALTRSKAFYMDICVEKGEIAVYIEQQHYSTVSDLIENVIQEARCKLIKEEEIRRIGSCLSCSFALGCGGYVHDVILPGEYREIMIESKNVFYDFSRITLMLREHGALQSVEETSRGISVTFQKVAHARNALQSLQKISRIKVTSKVNVFAVVEKSLPLFKIHVTWCRLPCVGSGTIEFFNSMDCIEASYLLNSNAIYIDKKYVLFTPSEKYDTELDMENLPATIEKDDIMKSLIKHFPCHLRIKSVNLSRMKSKKTTEDDLSAVRKQLLQVFCQYTSSSKLVIDVKTPGLKDSMWIAFVYFENVEDGSKAMLELEGNIKINKYTASFTPILNSSIHCQSDIFNVIEKNLHDIIKNFKKLNICQECEIKPNKNATSIAIIFSCKNISDLSKVRHDITKLTQGRQILCSDNPKYFHLFSKSARSFLKDIEHSTKTVVTVDSIKKIISIYGSENACARAQMEITCFGSAASVSRTKVFDLCGTNMPFGFLKTLYKKYGFDLKGLISSYKLKAADINVLDHKLTIVGPPKRIQEVEDHLEKICSDLYSESLKEEKNEKKDDNSCPVCFDIISYDFFRLENCGHAVCKPCLQLQIESEVIPLVCAEKDCGKPFFIEDLKKIFVGKSEMKEQFCAAALRYYVNRNVSEVRYCPTPNCYMIYRVTAEDPEYHCPVCENVICIRCHNLHHPGMSCEMYQNVQIDEDYSLKMWLQEDAANRKTCPSCSMAIEKSGGCNHVICTQCQTDICWLCLRTFKDGNAVYEHLPVCPMN